MNQGAFYLKNRGNQDQELYEAAGQGRRMDLKLDWMIRDLGPEAIEWLRSLPAAAVFEDQVLLCHESPTDAQPGLLLA